VGEAAALPSGCPGTYVYLAPHAAAAPGHPMQLDDIRADFALLDDWEDRYRYVIELGRALPPLPEELRTDANKVRGCASQVWLATKRIGDPSHPSKNDRLAMQGTSDAHIVQGLIALLFAVYEDKSLADILTTDAERVFSEFGLKEHLTPQRSNGLASMVKRIRADASAMLAA
jgi:cysteine desulfuration protein SufE